MAFVKRKTVYVGLSGGVDSAVSAALLLRAGYDVYGVFIKTFSGQKDALTGQCTWVRERLDAIRVAAHLGIHFCTVDLEREYTLNVLTPFYREYEEGKTPNPDILCNQVIKFGVFANWAFAQGADFIATGHYARLVKQPNGMQTIAIPKDVVKDQTYFLGRVQPEMLSRILFPLGAITKSQVRALAKKFGLPVATKPDSQGLCFIGKVALPQFLSTAIPQSSGCITLPDGTVIGAHQGIAYYTIGQRHGIGVAHHEALYVAARHYETNTLIVAPKNHPLLWSQEIYLQRMLWFGTYGNDVEGKRFAARIRHRQELQEATLVSTDNQGIYKLVFTEVQWAPAPGQYVVLYDRGLLAGSGIINSSQAVAGLRVKTYNWPVKEIAG